MARLDLLKCTDIDVRLLHDRASAFSLCQQAEGHCSLPKVCEDARE